MSLKVVQVRFAGRFGNNLFQYAFGRALAERYGAELQTEPWVGQQIFPQVKENPISQNGVEIFEPKGNFDAHEILRLTGFFQKSFYTQMFTRSQARRWFEIKPDLRITSTAEKVFHIRWGDKLQEPFSPVVSKQSYVRAAQKFGYDPVQFKEVSEADPHTNPTLPGHLQFLVDFQILSKTQVLFRGNSSFAWWTAVLGNPKVYSARINGLRGLSDCEFEEGNHCPFLSENQPNISNPPE
jgi:hypothetical protein